MSKDPLCYDYTWIQLVINFYVRKDNEVFIQGWILVDFMSETKTGIITNLLGIEDNFLELSSFCKALNDLIGDVGSEVDTEGKSWIDRLHQISKLLRALQLQTQRKPTVQVYKRRGNHTRILRNTDKSEHHYVWQKEPSQGPLHINLT